MFHILAVANCQWLPQWWSSRENRIGELVRLGESLWPSWEKVAWASNGHNWPRDFFFCLPFLYLTLFIRRRLLSLFSSQWETGPNRATSKTGRSFRVWFAIFRLNEWRKKKNEKRLFFFFLMGSFLEKKKYFSRFYFSLHSLMDIYWCGRERRWRGRRRRQDGRRKHWSRFDAAQLITRAFQ